jgi:hypothetical protein
MQLVKDFFWPLGMVTVSLYVLKAILQFRHVGFRVAIIVFVSAVLVSVPLLYWFDPNWGSRFIIDYKAIYVGGPLCFLTIPVVSFALDRTTIMRRWPRHFIVARWLGEIIVVFPMWEMLCFYIIGSFGWFWV